MHGEDDCGKNHRVNQYGGAGTETHLETLINNFTALVPGPFLYSANVCNTLRKLYLRQLKTQQGYHFFFSFLQKTTEILLDVLEAFFKTKENRFVSANSF